MLTINNEAKQKFNAMYTPTKDKFDLEYIKKLPVYSRTAFKLSAQK